MHGCVDSSCCGALAHKTMLCYTRFGGAYVLVYEVCVTCPGAVLGVVLLRSSFLSSL